MPLLTRLSTLIAFLLVIAACTSQPILNVTDAPIRPGYSMEQIGAAIIHAGQGRGWAMKKVRPGLIRGTLDLRKHHAVVDVSYTTTSFSINYVDSTNLDHHGDTIHRNYNHWVNNLRADIEATLRPKG